MHKAANCLVLLVAVLAYSAVATAQDFPVKPIRIVVPYASGGGMADRMARLVAEKLQVKWSQPIIVENRAGAAANIGAEYVAKSSPDGYTLLYLETGPLVVNKSLFSKLAYDPEAFVPVSLMVTSPNVLIVNPKVPASSLQQLIAFATANPDRLNYGSNGSGGAPHLTAEMFKTMARVKMVHVPYKGVPPALTDLLGGQLDVMFVGLGSVLQQIRAGKLRVLGVGSEKRSSLLPDTPAIAEVLPGFVSGGSFGMVAPPTTPPAIANKLSGAIAEFLKQPEVVKQLLDLNLEVIGSTPAEMASFLKQDSDRWGPLIKSLGVTVE